MRPCLLLCCQQMPILLVLSKLLLKSQTASFLPSYLSLHPCYNRKSTQYGFYLACEVTQSCPTLSNPMDCSLPGSSIHGIFQARVLEWGAIAFSKKQIFLNRSTLSESAMTYIKLVIRQQIQPILALIFSLNNPSPFQTDFNANLVC